MALRTYFVRRVCIPMMIGDIPLIDDDSDLTLIIYCTR